MTDTLENSRNLIAVGGPLHGHVVTVHQGTQRVIALVSQSDGLAPTPATHDPSGIKILESVRDGDAFVTYVIYRRHGFLCLIADVDSLGNDVARDRAIIAALAIYAGLSQGVNV